MAGVWRGEHCCWDQCHAKAPAGKNAIDLKSNKQWGNNMPSEVEVDSR